MRIVLCLLLVAAAMAVKAQDTLAIQSYASTDTGLGAGTVGWSFQPLTNISVTALGCFDYFVTNQPGAVWVGLWSADGSLLASNVVTTNSTLLNQARYEPIDPVPLLTNRTYYAGAFGPSGEMVIQVFLPGSGYGYVNLAPEIQLGTVVASTNTTFSFPGVVGGPSGSAILAPNFEFQDGIKALALNIAFTNHTVVISWPSSYVGFVLQENGGLGTTNWMTTTNPVVKVGQQNQVLIPSPAGNNFYRLQSQ